MKNIFLTVLAVIMLAVNPLLASSDNNNNPMEKQETQNGKILIAYFSWAGNT